MPLAQRPYAQANLVVRGRAEDPWLLLPVLREAVHAVEPALPLFRTRTLDQHVGNSYREATVMAWLLSAFAVLAVALSAAGLYGLLSWQVRTRTREIGIRLAIGATADAVRRQFLRRGMTLTAVGVALGLGVAVWAGQFLEALLYGLSVHDPVTLAAVTAGFLLVALLATWAPAARSARIDPMQALREE
jgi:putative ABC transport system permease protein